MKYQVFRGLRKLLYAKVTIGSDGNETWGVWKELAGLQTCEFAPNESSETIYFDNIGAIVMDIEGDQAYTLGTSVPDLQTRTEISGRTWDDTKKCALGTKLNKSYYAIGFLYGTQDGEEYLKVVLKGKFGGASESYVTEDNSTTHNIYQMTFNAVTPKVEIPYNGGSAQMSAYCFKASEEDIATYLSVGGKVMDVTGVALPATA